MAVDKAVDEVLEFIWTEREMGFGSISKLLGNIEVIEAGADAKTLEAMEKEGFIRLNGDAVSLTGAGERLAEAA
ncbi:MAG: hypothetical protein HZB83_06165, partial [Deltaproteobacteria bacterium]|nr:hypothetical protein [Deltaproteobacteria bacterium]